jgi:hypothetical protein
MGCFRFLGFAIFLENTFSGHFYQFFGNFSSITSHTFKYKY